MTAIERADGPSTYRKCNSARTRTLKAFLKKKNLRC